MFPDYVVRCERCGDALSFAYQDGIDPDTGEEIDLRFGWVSLDLLSRIGPDSEVFACWGDEGHLPSKADRLEALCLLFSAYIDADEASRVLITEIGEVILESASDVTLGELELVRIAAIADRKMTGDSRHLN